MMDLVNLKMKEIVPRTLLNQFWYLEKHIWLSYGFFNLWGIKFYQKMDQLHDSQS